MPDENVLFVILMTALVTAFTRALPFIFFRNRKQPAFLAVVERDFPPMVMLLLVIYCLKDVSLWTAPFGIPEMIGISVVAGMHIWKRNTLLSISAGTLLYMYLLRTGIDHTLLP